MKATDQKQTPWDSSSLVGDVYFANAPGGTAPQGAIPAVAPTASLPSTPRQASAPDAAVKAETECERLAAYHVRTLASAREKVATDWTHAVAVCQAEVAAHPGDPHFVHLLGRAQDRARNYGEALRDFRTAADAGSVDALVDLGMLYHSGHGVLQS